MFDMFNFLGMAGDYESRKVDNYEQDGLYISTCLVTDGEHDYETAIEHPEYNKGDLIVVEAYDTREDAQEGHKRWVDTMINNPPDKLVECLNSKISQLCGPMEHKRTIDKKEK